MPGQKKVLVAFPPLMLQEIDEVAAKEHRTRCDLIREALRRYLEDKRLHRSLHAVASK